MSEVHIVMASYNGEQYIGEQIESILNGTYKDVTIEICDDGSKDGTPEIIKEYREKYPQIISLHTNDKNQGYVKNFLEGVKRSESPYIMFCDQDDIWLPDKVETTLEHMKKVEAEAKDAPVMVYADAYLYDNDTKETRGRFQESSHLRGDKVSFANILMENKCIGCTVMMNASVREYMKEIKEWENIRVHDWWVALICACFGKIAYFDKPTLLYRQHNGNMIGGSSFGNYFTKRLKALGEQRRAIKKCVLQGQEFLQCYETVMSKEQRDTATVFAEMYQHNWFARRRICLKYGFTKSGLVRNIGLLFVL